jgi:serine/threonine-protein kinase RsbW
VLRTATAGLAARLDFTIEDLEDVRMAVGEAAALVLEAAAPDAGVTTRFWMSPRELTIAVRARTVDPPPEPDGFAWTVITTLARQATATTQGGVFEITLRTVSSLPSSLPSSPPFPVDGAGGAGADD